MHPAVDRRFNRAARQPDVSLVICATPRSGSTWFTQELARNGYGIGEEYLNPRYKKGIGPGSLELYLKTVYLRRTGKSNVFTLKVFPAHLQTVGVGLSELLDALPGEKRVIRYDRLDKDAQGASLFFARTTGVWQYDAPHARRAPPAYEARFITAAKARLRAQDIWWAEQLEELDHKILCYEDLRANLQKELSKVFEFCGKEPVPEEVEFPEWGNFWDPVKALYLEQYRRDMEAQDAD